MENGHEKISLFCLFKNTGTKRIEEIGRYCIEQGDVTGIERKEGNDQKRLEIQKSAENLKRNTEMNRRYAKKE